MSKRRGHVVAVRGRLEMLYDGKGEPKPGNMDEMCRIYDPGADTLSEEMPVQQVLKWGYWEPPPRRTGSKAKRRPTTGGRWKTLRDGKRVYITGSIPRAYTVTRAGVQEHAEARVEMDLERLSQRMGIPVEGLEEEIEKSITEAIEGKPIAINVSYKVLPQILQDGRFKNQYETGRSGGMFDPKLRMDAEVTTFDVERPDPVRSKKGTPVSDFPVYGYVYNGSGNAAAGLYGDVRIELKESAKRRTTMTVGDSLGMMMDGNIAPAPLSRAVVEKGCWDGYSWMHRLAAGAWKEVSYFEAQIHDGVNMSDVARIVLPKFHNLPDYMQRNASYIEDLAKRYDVEVVYGE